MTEREQLITDLNIAIGEWDEDHPVSFMLLTRCRAALAARVPPKRTLSENLELYADATDENLAVDQETLAQLLRDASTALAADAQDARRYRWLRLHATCAFLDRQYGGPPLDAAIDAALAQAPEDNKR
jgi:hypothetical protein